VGDFVPTLARHYPFGPLNRRLYRCTPSISPITDLNDRPRPSPGKCHFGRCPIGLFRWQGPSRLCLVRRVNTYLAMYKTLGASADLETEECLGSGATAERASARLSNRRPIAEGFHPSGGRPPCTFTGRSDHGNGDFLAEVRAKAEAPERYLGHRNPRTPT